MLTSISIIVASARRRALTGPAACLLFVAAPRAGGLWLFFPPGPPPRGLGCGDLVAREGVAFRLREPNSVPQHRGRGRPQNTRGWIPEGRALGGDPDVGAEHHVGAAADAPALHRRDRRLRGVPELHVH